jgi:pyruvate kinase
MVARGDLGVEVALDEVPLLQKRMIRMCNEAGKPVITATQMLESMLENPRPTRAEVSDIANAVLDGTDALMLSGETAVGRYPAAAAKIMARAAARAESQIDFAAIRVRHAGAFAENPTEAIAEAACLIAHDLRAHSIISSTSSGFTAQMVSKHRPACPIIAVTPSETTYRRLCLVWGVTPVLVERSRNTDEMFRHAIAGALKSRFVRRGDFVVITAGVRVGVPGQTSLVRIARVP